MAFTTDTGSDPNWDFLGREDKTISSKKLLILKKKFLKTILLVIVLKNWWVIFTIDTNLFL